jgi:hypothetical protein
MTDYIDRKAALSMREPPKLNRHYQTDNLDDAYGQGWDDALCCLEQLPAADVAPVVHGRRVMHDDELGLTCECSVCHIETMGNVNCCPNCGAKMDGAE